MRVFTPSEVAKHAANKYLAVLVAAKYARVINEFPRDRSSSREKKLTTRALKELASGAMKYGWFRGAGTTNFDAVRSVFFRALHQGRL